MFTLWTHFSDLHLMLWNDRLQAYNQPTKTNHKHWFLLLQTTLLKLIQTPMEYYITDIYTHTHTRYITLHLKQRLLQYFQNIYPQRTKVMAPKFLQHSRVSQNNLMTAQLAKPNLENSVDFQKFEKVQIKTKSLETRWLPKAMISKLNEELPAPDDNSAGNPKHGLHQTTYICWINVYNNKPHIR